MTSPKISRISFQAKISQLDENFMKKKRVVAYARVSTSSTDQLNSLTAQKQFYESYIKSHPSWEFCGLYADEGISGLSSRHRPAFKAMIDNALSGNIDLIITKSVSRFARNTVDTISYLRQLKAAGCEVFFEKEDIWTFDSKGEFMITLLSCLAQEESRNISENVTWGHRKRFADGQYAVAYKRFLGYERGMVINESQAKIVRIVFDMYLTGYSEQRIAKIMEVLSIPAPGGQSKWYSSTVSSIVSNEKYKGDALLQKKYTIDYLTKKTKKNNGELPQYYVTDGHAPIIPKRTFDEAQTERVARKQLGRKFSCLHPLSSKIICPKCGGFFGSYKAHYIDNYWLCHNQRKTKEPHYRRFRYEIMEQLCNEAIHQLMVHRQNEIVTVLESIDTISGDERTLLYDYIYKIVTQNKTLLISEQTVRILISRVYPQLNNIVNFQFINGHIEELQLPS